MRDHAPLTQVNEQGVATTPTRPTRSRAMRVLWSLLGVLVVGIAGLGALLLSGALEGDPAAEDVVVHASGDDPDVVPEREADDDASVGDADGRPEVIPAEEEPTSASDARDADVGEDPEVPSEEAEDVALLLNDECEVTVSAQRAEEDPAPWEFADCVRAPVDLEDASRQWIVVLASFNGEDFSESDALARAASMSADDVLWSTHYPSLNPDLWVVFDGPFGSESEAAEIASIRGDGSYPRVLSDDLDDRYCDAADGCVGERDR